MPKKRHYKQGHYTPINPEKWVGNKKPIYRSGWERQTFKWLDMNPDVVAVASENVCIPYVSKVDGKIHRYFIDATVKWKSGAVVLVEIKPAAQTHPPVPTKGKTKVALLEEAATWEINKAKWKSASLYAKQNGVSFQIWTEDVLKKIGVLT